MSVLLLLFIIPSITAAIIYYAAGLVVPASHIVSKSTSFKISSKKLWHILTSVSEYPKWQPKIDAINIDKVDLQENRIVFVEYSTRKKQTVITQHEIIPFRRLIRMINEDTTLSYQLNKKSSFSGSWSFELTENEDNNAELKVTEQGIIKNPFTRVFHYFVLGYTYRLDRFFNDLQSYVVNEGEILATVPDNNSFSIQHGDVSPLDLSVVTANDEITVDDKQEEDQLLNESVADDTTLGHQVEATDESMIKSKLEWDLVSEIYERANIPNADSSSA